MSVTWPHTSHAKIHEGCDGYIRWVEAFQQPGVGFTGQCQKCGREGIVTEEIIPIDVGMGETGYEWYRPLEIENLEQLEWDEDASFEENQARLKEELGL